MLCSVDGLLVTEDLGHPVRFVFKGQAVVYNCLKMELRDCPTTLVTNYQPTFHNITEEQTYLHHGESLKSCIGLMTFSETVIIHLNLPLTFPLCRNRFPPTKYQQTF